jgi:hypothetical protein
MVGPVSSGVLTLAWFALVAAQKGCDPWQSGSCVGEESNCCLGVGCGKDSQCASGQCSGYDSDEGASCVAKAGGLGLAGYSCLSDSVCNSGKCETISSGNSYCVGSGTGPSLLQAGDYCSTDPGGISSPITQTQADSQCAIPPATNAPLRPQNVIQLALAVVTVAGSQTALTRTAAWVQAASHPVTVSADTAPALAAVMEPAWRMVVLGLKVTIVCLTLNATAETAPTLLFQCPLALASASAAVPARLFSKLAATATPIQVATKPGS